MALITMTILYLLIKRQPTSQHVTVFFYVGTATFFLLGIGLSLVTLLSLDWDGNGGNYLYTPWLLPTLCLVFFVLILPTYVQRPAVPGVVLSRLPNPVDVWSRRSSHCHHLHGGSGRDAAQEPGVLQHMRGFVGGKEKQ